MGCEGGGLCVRGERDSGSIFLCVLKICPAPPRACIRLIDSAVVTRYPHPSSGRASGAISESDDKFFKLHKANILNCCWGSSSHPSFTKPEGDRGRATADASMLVRREGVDSPEVCGEGGWYLPSGSTQTRAA